MPEGRRPRGVTPRLRSGAAAESTTLRRRRNGGEELPHIRGRGGAVERRYPASEVRGSNKRSYPTPEARGSGWEDHTHVHGAVAAGAQEGLEELSHVEGQEGRQ